jgi:hypothetical protein
MEHPDMGMAYGVSPFAISRLPTFKFEPGLQPTMYESGYSAAWCATQSWTATPGARCCPTASILFTRNA